MAPEHKFHFGRAARPVQHVCAQPGRCRHHEVSLDDDLDDDDDETSEIASEQPKPKMPKVLYALSGYKVWLGSVFANNRKLVSDGADNTVIVHSFDEDEDAILRSQQEDDEDNDLGDGPFSSLS